MKNTSYSGTELELFLHVRNWKTYWSRIIRRYVRGDALEVGAGLGANLPLLYDAADSWTCLEPDAQLCAELRRRMDEGRYGRCEAVCGSIEDLDRSAQFDAILYIDVLEHIRNDRAELAEAATHLKPGGNLIVLAPAHQWLFTPFDKAIGHERRYTAASLVACLPQGFQVQTIRYLDSVGLFASLANRLLLKQSLPTPRQVRVWDRFMVPVSRVLDPILGYRFGKSVLVVGRTTSAGT